MLARPAFIRERPSIMVNLRSLASLRRAALIRLVDWALGGPAQGTLTGEPCSLALLSPYYLTMVNVKFVDEFGGSSYCSFL